MGPLWWVGVMSKQWLLVLGTVLQRERCRCVGDAWLETLVLLPAVARAVLVEETPEGAPPQVAPLQLEGPVLADAKCDAANARGCCLPCAPALCRWLTRPRQSIVTLQS